MGKIVAVYLDPDDQLGDLHVVAGDGPNHALGHLLLVDDASGKTLSLTAGIAAMNATAHAADVEFETNLRSPGDFGIRFEPVAAGDTSGLLVVGSTTAVGQTAEPLRSFVLACSITSPAVPPAQKIVLASVRIRVHVHARVESMWLTPSPLTIPRGTTQYRASLIARFDDGVVGDITNWGTVNWSAPAPFKVTPTNLKVATASGRIEEVPSNASVGANADLTATYASSASGKSLTAKTKLVVGSAMKDLADTGLEIFQQAIPFHANAQQAGGHANAPITAPPGPPTNVLFVSEGWGRQEKDAFRSFVAKIVHQLDNEPAWIPYATLRTQINYWTCWVPSPPGAVGVTQQVPSSPGGVGSAALTAIEPPGPGGPSGGAAVNPNAESVVEPQDPSGIGPADWGVRHVIFEFGPPVPLDAAHKLSRDAQVDKWLKRYKTKVTRALKEDVHRRWARARLGREQSALAGDPVCDLRLLDERDTAFGMKFGDRPGGSTLNRTLSLSARRARSRELIGFLNGVHLPNASGARWLQGGADSGLVVFVVRGIMHGGAAYHASEQPHAACSVATDNAFVASSRADGGATFSTPPLPGGAFDVVHTVAHELAHMPRFAGLGDEYYEVPGTRFTGQPGANPERTGNTQSEAKLIANVQGQNVIDGGRIRWLWPRIRSAGLLSEPPTPRSDAANPNRWLLKLRPGHGAQFDGGKGDKGHLRKWPLDIDNATPSASQSVEFKIQSKPSDDQLLVVAQGTFTLPADPHDWLFFVPTRAPDGSPLGIVHGDILAHIKASHAPLEGSAVLASDRQNGNYVMLPDKLPPSLVAKLGASTANWVGLYSNGAGYEKGAFHPAGTCAMRRSGNMNTERFCHVCRYIIVDRIDPTQHRAIDDLYKRDYPRVGP
ncbi:MAG TPA: hypothetical protein VGO80_22945 [Solirubrobacteraceae bacterium]|jgi:hypothetical protein|nr:hypothetical protein [Solirubrobacteraceae bacterium]